MKISNTMKIKQQDGSFEDVKISYIAPEYCTIEGTLNKVGNAYYAHVEGYNNSATGDQSHAEGKDGFATGSSSHVEGTGCRATTFMAHAEGMETKAGGLASHSEGGGTIAASEYQHVQGQYNIEDANNTYAHIVGNGTSESNRSNAHTLDWDGNAWFAGDITLGEDNISINLFNNLIWENPSPNSPGSEDGWIITNDEEKDIGMYYSEAMKNLNKYSFIYIIFKTVYNGDYITDIKIPVPQNIGQNYSRQVFSLSNAASSNTIEILTRSVIVTQSEEEIFYIEIPSGKVKKITATEATVNNNILIPVAIYGIL